MAETVLLVAAAAIYIRSRISKTFSQKTFWQCSRISSNKKINAIFVLNHDRRRCVSYTSSRLGERQVIVK